MKERKKVPVAKKGRSKIYIFFIFFHSLSQNIRNLNSQGRRRKKDKKKFPIDMRKDSLSLQKI
jgi:hypothetical protein